MEDEVSEEGERSQVGSLLIHAPLATRKKGGVTGIVVVEGRLKSDTKDLPPCNCSCTCFAGSSLFGP